MGQATGVLITIILLTMGCGASATEPTPPSTGTVSGRPHPVKAELIAEHASIQPGGKTRIGVYFDLEEEWHIYAEHPGDAGLPTSIQWSASPNWVFGPLRWPAPQQFIDPGAIKTYGYSGAVVLSSEAKVSEQTLPDHTETIRANVKWLACREICIPGSAELQLLLPVSGLAPALSTHAQLFDHAE